MDEPPASAPAPVATTPSTTTTTIPIPEPPPVTWVPCEDGLQCASVTVPVDYLDPGAGTLDLALVRRPASDPQRRIGTLLVDPGGPGASPVRRVRRGFRISDEVAARFDIVGVDPRGVGGSTPITCGATVPALRAVDLDPDDPREELALEEAARAVAEECAATEGARLSHLGTREVVLDLEVVRRTLGDGPVTFVGLSYGTLVGLLWADAFPTSVRAMVLDGVVDPLAAGDALGLDQVDGVERAFRAMDDACAADPACPLTQRGTTLAQAYDQLAASIEAGAGQTAGVGPTQLVHAVFAATYGAERWPGLWRAVADALDGRFAGLAEQARWYAGLVDYPPFALVSCLDAEHPEGFDAWQRAARLAADRSPRFGRTLANELLPCAFWPQATLGPVDVRAEGAGPILLVGTTGDVATPIGQMTRVASALEGDRRLTVEGHGHIAIGSSPCVDEAVTRFLVDPAGAPEEQRC